MRSFPQTSRRAVEASATPPVGPQREQQAGHSDDKLRCVDGHINVEAHRGGLRDTEAQ
jgi:hypothetical protein